MRFIYIMITAVLALSCASQQITTEISEKASLNAFKKTGILIRAASNTSVKNADLEKNLTYWFAGYKMNSELVIIKGAPEKLTGYNDTSDRFYQLSDSRQFLKYKSLGAVLMFTSENEAALKKIFADNSLDSLIIYEVDSDYSMELQYYDYETMVVAFDPELKAVYMDHNSVMMDTDEFDTEKGRSGLMDNISKRLLQTLESLGFVDNK